MKKYLLLILSFLFLFASSTEAGMLRHNRAQHLSGLWRLYQIDPTGLVSWQKQRDPRTGSSAALWNDLSGQDNDMAQVTSGNQPTVVTGRSGYRTFDGTTDFMSQAEQDDETGATFWPTNAGMCVNAGNARFRVAGVNLASQFAASGDATHVLVFHTATHTGMAYIGPADSAEALGAAKGVDGITKANPGVITFDPGHGYVNGQMVKLSGLTEMTELNDKYTILAGNVGDTFTILNTSGYGSAETTGGNCSQAITNVGTDGVLLYSEKTLDTQSLAYAESGINYNAITTFEVYKSDFNITGDLTILASAKTSASGNIGIVTKWGGNKNRLSFMLWFHPDNNLSISISQDGLNANSKILSDYGSHIDNTWRLFGGVYSSSTYLRLFVNGVQTANNTTNIFASLFDTPHPFYIGAYSWNNVPSNFWNGSIAEVMVFSRALSAAESGQVYKSFGGNRGRNLP